jgi:hypothetical protein
LCVAAVSGLSEKKEIGASTAPLPFQQNRLEANTLLAVHKRHKYVDYLGCRLNQLPNSHTDNIETLRTCKKSGQKPYLTDISRS